LEAALAAEPDLYPQDAVVEAIELVTESLPEITLP
jgi:hypothetical protein